MDSFFCGHPDEMCQELSCQILSLPGRVHSNALDHIAGQTAGGNQLSCIIKNACCIVHRSRTFQTALG